MDGAFSDICMTFEIEIKGGKYLKLGLNFGV
jgi:hypothetical protein